MDLAASMQAVYEERFFALVAKALAASDRALARAYGPRRRRILSTRADRKNTRPS